MNFLRFFLLSYSTTHIHAFLLNNCPSLLPSLHHCFLPFLLLFYLPYYHPCFVSQDQKIDVFLWGFIIYMIYANSAVHKYEKWEQTMLKYIDKSGKNTGNCVAFLKVLTCFVFVLFKYIPFYLLFFFYFAILIKREIEFYQCLEAK